MKKDLKYHISFLAEEKKMLDNAIGYIIVQLDEELSIRTGFSIDEYRQLIGKINNSDDTQVFSEDEMLMLHQILNEVCHGVLIDDFDHKVGATLDDAKKLMRSLDAITCSLDDNFEKFSYVLAAMTDENVVIRRRAAELVSNVGENEVREVLEVFDIKNDVNSEIHLQCLELLLESADITPGKVIQLLNSEYPLARKYGAILGKKLFKQYPHLLKEALANEDPDIQYISNEFINGV